MLEYFVVPLLRGELPPTRFRELISGIFGVLELVCQFGAGASKSEAEIIRELGLPLRTCMFLSQLSQKAIGDIPETDPDGDTPMLDADGPPSNWPSPNTANMWTHLNGPLLGVSGWRTEPFR